MLTAFDVAVGILVLISALLATARGLTREVLSLVTWAGSAAIALWMYLYHPDIARGLIREPIVADVATVIVSFIVALIVLHLLTMRIADFVVDSRIGPLDRTLGFVFGGVRGVLIAAVIVVFGQWGNWPGVGQYVEGSKSIDTLDEFGQGLLAMAGDFGLEGFLPTEGDDGAPQDAPVEEVPNADASDAGNTNT